MTYLLDIGKAPDKKFRKLAKKDKAQHLLVLDKIQQILEDPYRFKPLRNPMAGQRGAHIGSFVLTYEIDENNRTVKVLDYDHHDKVYKV
ncbi:type II toxin-antitoxin system RelE/ParE family toxin [Candidatus Micrarchaeota archaeon]|nr:type II toxin-antitoxin system RelE/ParE family toxin [Candidatus Micrarchaeota archaeon]